MKFKIIIILVLLITNFYLFKYLKQIENEKNEFNFYYDDIPILIQIKDIELNRIEDFSFNNYFKIISFNTYSYKYNFDDNNLYIKINDNIYSFPYSLIEPEVIKEIVYVEKEVPIIEENDEYEREYEYKDSNYFYVENDYLVFDLDEDLGYIRQILSSNINTTYETSIDFSNLNVSQVGQYSVFYTTNNEKIEIIVEIR